MQNVGNTFINLSFYASIYLNLALLLSIAFKSPSFRKSSFNALISIFTFLTISLISLLCSFYAKDFNILYVASNTSKDLPVSYAISAIWDGERGSFLIFNWLISLFIIIKISLDLKAKQKYNSHSFLIMSIIQLFYIYLSLFIVNPFAKSIILPKDGSGLNPILQNEWMFIHPLAAFLSYSIIIIPFSEAIGSLLTKESTFNWIADCKTWIISSWLLLLLGNATGAAWAYITSGWGGIWKWDAVQICYIVPLLSMTGLAHSIIIEEKRGMLKTWNQFLMYISFIFVTLCIYISNNKSTNTIHRFYKPLTGDYILYFLIGLAIFSLILLLFRKKDLISKNKLDSLLSRESSFLFNNLLVLSMAISILLGIAFPFVKNLITGQTVIVSKIYYNEILYPFICLLIFHTGFCITLAWKKTSIYTFKKFHLNPLVIGSLFAIVSYLTYINYIDKLFLAKVLSFFVIFMSLIEIKKELKVAVKIKKDGVSGKGIIKSIIRRKKSLCGHIIHIGIAFSFLGACGGLNSYKKNIEISKGANFSFNNYTFTNEGMKTFPAYKGRFVAESSIFVEKDNKSLGRVRPQNNFFENSKKKIKNNAIISSLSEDIVISLDSYMEDEEAIYTITINPLMKIFWIGIWIIIVATLILIL